MSTSARILAMLERVDTVRAELDALRPLAPEVQRRAMQKLRLDWNYHSNAIEGNSLNYGETAAFLMHGVTAKGKPLKDHLDIRGHSSAIDFLVDVVRRDATLTEKDIRELHSLILAEPYEVDALTLDGEPTRRMIRLGEYKRASNHVMTASGEVHYFASPEETPIKMGELLVWLRGPAQKLHPLVRASQLHHRLTAIHPFDDGNGRVARLLMNLVLMEAGYPPAVIRREHRGEYYGVLAQADAGVKEPLLALICTATERSLSIYLKAARGESIVEPDDLDKEISLLKQEVESRRLSSGHERTQESRDFLVQHVLSPLWHSLEEKMRRIDEFFQERRMRMYEITDRSNPTSYKVASVPLALAQTVKNRDTASAVLLVRFLGYRHSISHFDLECFLALRLKPRGVSIQPGVGAVGDLAEDHAHFELPVEGQSQFNVPYMTELSPATHDAIVRAFIKAILTRIRQADQASRTNSEDPSPS